MMMMMRRLPVAELRLADELKRNLRLIVSSYSCVISSANSLPPFDNINIGRKMNIILCYNYHSFVFSLYSIYYDEIKVRCRGKKTSARVYW